MRRYLVNRERDFFSTSCFRQNKPVALVDWYSTLKIGEGKGRLSIATVSSTDQLKQCFVLRDRKQLAGTKHPAGGREVAREHSDLTNVWLCH
jgi:hypothetical protein